MNNNIDNIRTFETEFGYGFNKTLYYTMELQGEASVMVTPDIAVMNIGVETTNMDLRTAQQENAKRTQQVIIALKKLGIDEKDIQTERYNIEKKYEYEELKKIDRGYMVTNMLEVTVRDIDQAGEVVDSAVLSGANLVNEIRFQIEYPGFYYQQALNLAVKDVMKKADSVARQMGVRIFQVPIRLVEEGGRQVPSNNGYFVIERNVQTPIQPGQNQIVARVKGVFAYSVG